MTGAQPWSPASSRSTLHDSIGCPTLADAILDRLYEIKLKGESIRRKMARAQAKETTGP